MGWEGGRDDEEKIQAVWLGINCAKMKKALASWIRERERERHPLAVRGEEGSEAGVIDRGHSQVNNSWGP